MGPLKLNVTLIGGAIFSAFVSILAFYKIIESTQRLGFEGGVFLSQPLGSIYDISPYLAPICWGIIIGTLVWKGKIRSSWQSSGYDYETFKMITKMKGSPMRIKLLTTLDLPKNRSQLAQELNVDWKAIDNHMRVLKNNNFVDEMATVGTSTYYIITEKGKNLLKLLKENGNLSN